MRLLFLALLLTLPAATSRLVEADEPQPKEVTVRDSLSLRHFPMKVGDCWSYDYGEKRVVFTVLRRDKLDETSIIVVKRAIGDDAVEFKLSVEEDGVYIHAEGKKVFAPPLRQFAFFAKTGDVWKWRGTESGKRASYDFENLGRQEVDVPAGKFKGIAVRQNNAHSGEESTFWLAEGVGIVRLSGKRELSKEGRPEIFEWNLKSFKREE